MSAEENKALVRRWYEEVQVGRRFDLVPEFVAPEYRQGWCGAMPRLTEAVTVP